MLDAIGIGVPYKLWHGIAVWSPSALFASSEVGVWYDPSDLSTMFQNSDGTTAVAVGDPVGYIADKSGNGFHATQATAASRPVLRQTVGGLYYLEFDGTDDCLFTSAIDFTGTDKLSLFVGLKKLTDIDYSMVCELSGGGVGTFSIMAPSNTGDGYASWLGSSGPRQTSVNYLQPSLNTLAITHDMAGAAYADETIFRVNGSVVASSGTAVSIAEFVNQPLYIGRRTNSTLPFTGHIYSFVVRGAMSDATEISNAEAYVNGKTGAY